MHSTELRKKSLELRKNKGFPIKVFSNYKVCSREELSIAYTPGVAEISKLISAEKEKVFELTGKGNLVAVVSDGTAVLGLGDVGPEAAIPVVETKAALFQEFAEINAFPIVLNSKVPEKIIQAVSLIAPTFGAINLEDIAAPQCFKVSQELESTLPIPVFHDDQQGAAIAVLAALKNALSVVGKKLSEVKIVVLGQGAAGTATTNLLLDAGAKTVIGVDKNGAIGFDGEFFGCLHEFHQQTAKRTGNKEKASLEMALKGADVFIGVSKEGLFKPEFVELMASSPIIFALANPAPEIMPSVALKAGAGIVATGRSDFPNQINNCLVYPGFFRGLLDSRAEMVSNEMLMAVANALSGLVSEPSTECIVPDPFNPQSTPAVALAVATAAKAKNLPELRQEYIELSKRLEEKFVKC